MDYASGKHKGFAFVEYGDAEDAHECIYNLDGSELYGRVLSVNLARENKSNNNSNKAVWSTDEFFQTLHDKDQKKEVEGVLTEEGVAR
jgi:peptidyl-prolyl isomerase E (cyclophilin E)